MSDYIKHTWADGETIDATKLNNIESGIVEAKREAEKKKEIDPDSLTSPVPVTLGGTGAKSAENARANLGAASTNTYTASATTTWSGSASAGYTQTVSVAGILATDKPIVDCVFGTDISANKLYSTAWGLITRITTADGSITLYANTDKPATAFTIQLKVVR